MPSITTCCLPVNRCRRIGELTGRGRGGRGGRPTWSQNLSHPHHGNKIRQNRRSIRSVRPRSPREEKDSWQGTLLEENASGRGRGRVSSLL